MCWLVNNKSRDLTLLCDEVTTKKYSAFSQFRWCSSFHITICVLDTVPAVMMYDMIYDIHVCYVMI
jgi:hypothetical protein